MLYSGRAWAEVEGEGEGEVEVEYLGSLCSGQHHSVEGGQQPGLSFCGRNK